MFNHFVWNVKLLVVEIYSIYKSRGSQVSSKLSYDDKDSQHQPEVLDEAYWSQYARYDLASNFFRSRRKHIDFVWNVNNMPAWLHLANKLPCAWPVGVKVTYCKAVKHSNSCLNRNWECTETKLQKIGNEAIKYTGMYFTVVRLSSVVPLVGKDRRNILERNTVIIRIAMYVESIDSWTIDITSVEAPCVIDISKVLQIYRR